MFGGSSVRVPLLWASLAQLPARTWLRFQRCFLATTERRGRTRYPLRLPLAVRLEEPSSGREISTESKDVSSQGVYFFLAQSLKAGSPLEITMTLPAEITRAEPVRVRCEARVQRSQWLEEGRVGIAAKIERYRFLPGKRRKAG